MRPRELVDVHVGGKVRALRLARNLALDAVANLICCPVAHIEAIENGDERLDPEHLMLLARFFDVRPSAFFKGIAIPR
jgi:transcriptional regulator with XRE-family HTH domain